MIRIRQVLCRGKSGSGWDNVEVAPATLNMAQSYPDCLYTSGTKMYLREVALLVFKAIFANEESVEIEFNLYPIEKTRASKIRFVKLGGYTFIEQNPFKISPWGKETEEGHQTVWVMKGNKYIARVRDGKFQEIERSSN